MIVIAKLKAKSGQEKDMGDAIRRILPDVAKEEGTLVYTLHQSQSDPSVFMFYEKYADQDAFAHHSSTPYLKELFDALAPMLDGAPEIDMYNEIDGIDKK